VLGISLGAALGACSENQNFAPIQLTLNRPIDMAFACYGPLRLGTDPAGPVIPSAQPRGSCDLRSPQLAPQYDPDRFAYEDQLPRSQRDQLLDATGRPVMRPDGQPQLKDLGGYLWWGFILQSAQGTVALSNWPVEASD